MRIAALLLYAATVTCLALAVLEMGRDLRRLADRIARLERAGAAGWWHGTVQFSSTEYREDVPRDGGREE